MSGTQLFMSYTIYLHTQNKMIKYVKANGPVNVNTAAHRLTQITLMDKVCVCQNSHNVISFHCQNLLPKDLYFYHL